MLPISKVIKKRLRHELVNQLGEGEQKEWEEWVEALEDFNSKWTEVKTFSGGNAWSREGIYMKGGVGLEQIVFGGNNEEKRAKILQWHYEMYGCGKILSVQDWIVLKMREWKEGKRGAKEFIENDETLKELREFKLGLQDQIWIQGHRIFLPKITKEIERKIRNEKNILDFKERIDWAKSLTHLDSGTSGVSWKEWLKIKEQELKGGEGERLESEIRSKIGVLDKTKEEQWSQEWETQKESWKKSKERVRSWERWQEDWDRWEQGKVKERKEDGELQEIWRQERKTEAKGWENGNDFTGLWLGIMQATARNQKEYKGINAMAKSWSPYNGLIQSVLKEGGIKIWTREVERHSDWVERMIERKPGLEGARIKAVATRKIIKEERQSEMKACYEKIVRQKIGERMGGEEKDFEREVIKKEMIQALRAMSEKEMRQIETMPQGQGVFEKTMEAVEFEKWAVKKMKRLGEKEDREDLKSFLGWCGLWLEKMEEDWVVMQETMKVRGVDEGKGLKIEDGKGRSSKKIKDGGDKAERNQGENSIGWSWEENKRESRGGLAGLLESWIEGEMRFRARIWRQEMGSAILEECLDWKRGRGRLRDYVERIGCDEEKNRAALRAAGWSQEEVDLWSQKILKIGFEQKIEGRVGQSSEGLGLMAWEVQGLMERLQSQEKKYRKDKESGREDEEKKKKQDAMEKVVLSAARLLSEHFKNGNVRLEDRARALKSGLKGLGFSEGGWKAMLRDPKVMDVVLGETAKRGVNWEDRIQEEAEIGIKKLREHQDVSAVGKEGVRWTQVEYENDMQKWMGAMIERGMEVEEGMQWVKELMRKGVLIGGQKREVREKKREDEEWQEVEARREMELEEWERALKEVKRKEGVERSVVLRWIEEEIEEGRGVPNKRGGTKVRNNKGVREEIRNVKIQKVVDLKAACRGDFWDLIPSQGNVARSLEKWHDQWVEMLRLEGMEDRAMWVWKDPMDRGWEARAIKEKLEALERKIEGIQRSEGEVKVQEGDRGEAERAIRQEYEKLEQEVGVMNEEARRIDEERQEIFEEWGKKPGWIRQEGDVECEIKPINNSWGLVLEGMRMSHCIGGETFTTSGREGRCGHYRMTVRSKDGKEVEESTMTVAVHPTVRLEQHFRAHNATVGKESQKWANSFVEMLSEMGKERKEVIRKMESLKERLEGNGVRQEKVNRQSNTRKVRR